MIEKITKLKENFATFEQTYGRLMRNTDEDGYEFCAEGILGLTAGLDIKIHPEHNVSMFCINGVYLYLNIPHNIYDNLDLPLLISTSKLIGWGEQLKLTKKQIKAIMQEGEQICWASLNDGVRLTFSQFILLLDILDKLYIYHD
jgi:hypothetical protein